MSSPSDVALPRTALIQAARDALAHNASRDVAVVRVAVPAPEVKPLAWLAAQTEQKRGYWADRDGACEVALVVAADGRFGNLQPPHQVVQRRKPLLAD